MRQNQVIAIAMARRTTAKEGPPRGSPLKATSSRQAREPRANICVPIRTAFFGQVAPITGVQQGKFKALRGLLLSASKKLSARTVSAVANSRPLRTCAAPMRGCGNPWRHYSANERVSSLAFICVL